MLNLELMLVVPPSGQNWNLWNVQFEFSSGAIWWVDLELMLVVSSGQNWNQLKCLNFPFYWICLLCSWRDNSSYRSNVWVRCASGNVFEKNWKIVNVTSDHQAIINNNIIQCTSPMHKSPIFEGALSRTFTIFSGLVENLLGSPQKILAPSAPPRNTKKRHVFQILDIF